jgi:hypothetical protein
MVNSAQRYIKQISIPALIVVVARFSYAQALARRNINLSSAACTRISIIEWGSWIQLLFDFLLRGPFGGRWVTVLHGVAGPTSVALQSKWDPMHRWYFIGMVSTTELPLRRFTSLSRRVPRYFFPAAIHQWELDLLLVFPLLKRSRYFTSFMMNLTDDIIFLWTFAITKSVSFTGIVNLRAQAVDCQIFAAYLLLSRVDWRRNFGTSKTDAECSSCFRTVCRMLVPVST